MTTFVVFSMPGREELTRQTLLLLDCNGGARRAGGEKVFFYTSSSPTPAPEFMGWRTIALHPRQGAKLDYWEMLRLLPMTDLVVFEDDIVPCKNLCPFLERWPTPMGAAFTTFFNNGTRITSGGLHPAQVDGRGFWLSQCLKLPASFVTAAIGMDERTLTPSMAQDVALGAAAERLGLGVYYHLPSLVQHVGYVSTVKGAKLEGLRAPSDDFVGPEFDAMTLLP